MIEKGIRLVTNERTRYKHVFSINVRATKYIEDFLHIFKMNSPMFVEEPVWGLSKKLISEFCYDYMTRNY